MAKKKTTPKKTQKKQKKVIARAKATAETKAKVAAKPRAKAKPAASKSHVKREAKPRAATRTIQVGNQDVETVHLKPRSLAARAGAGGGDFDDVSVVEGADSESAEELLEEGQAFEAGIISGVEAAGDADESEVHTHEAPQDDVPEEYEENENK
jgi:hypothetical protein